MKLVADWKRIAKKAWSVRLAAISGAFSAAEVILPLYIDSIPRRLFAVLALVAAIGSAVSRVVDQPRMWR